MWYSVSVMWMQQYSTMGTMLTVRRYHTMPTFHGFGKSGLNLEGSGQNAKMINGKLKLCVTAW